MTTKLTLVELVKVYSRKIEDGRSPYYVLSKIMEEVGELSTEVAIHEGDSYKEAGKDGVIGESLDAIISLLDLIYLIKPDFNEHDLKRIAKPKCEKWFQKVEDFQNEKS